MRRKICSLRSFADRDTEELYQTGKNKRWQAIAKVALRKLDMLAAATRLNDMKVPPGNKLHELDEDRKGQHAIWINDQFRLCFRWTAEGAEDVEIDDYHRGRRG